MRFSFLSALPVNELKVETNEKSKNVKLVNNALNVSCEFKYLEEKFLLRFASPQFRFHPTKLGVKFRKQSIFSLKFVNGTFLECEEALVAEIPFQNVNIDFFGFCPKRMFEVDFSFESIKGEKFELKYSIALPVIKQSELLFKPPKMAMTDALTRQMCSAGSTLR